MLAHRPIPRGRLLRTLVASAALAVAVPMVTPFAGPTTMASPRSEPVPTADVTLHLRPAAVEDLGVQLPATARTGAITDRMGSGWQVFDLIEPVGDYTHDGVPDLIARTPEGDLRIYALTPAFGVAWWLPIGRDWGDARSITATGAVNGDANADVVVLRSDGTVRLYRGTGPGALNHYRVVLTGQTDLARIVGTGDLTGDGRGDLVGHSSDGALYLYPGDGTGGFRASREPLRAPEEVGDVTS